MKIKLVFILFLSFGVSIYGQIEKPISTLKIDDESTLKTDNKYSLSTGLSKPVNNFTLNKETKLKDPSIPFNRMHKPFDMNEDIGLLKPGQKLTPKWFKKDNEIKEEFKSDQYLGDFKSTSEFVQLIYRDHQSVDGDIVRIFVNDDVVRSSVALDGTFRGFPINLIKGFNKIDIQALNQGASGPNTAQFQLYDDLGNLITSNEWNLTTGVKATLIVVKE
ncbi:hypothetical protein [Aquimarina sp. RZ0]|uniref:hypothetical protein n=1 Tax=Aquimarina sp. RZ0 TaxID=2607730 RepID=UPI0011F1A779|nr:hypothetical protein [Aquimarina sp. RZ0]KAA1246889.1 hypothetical protein F0000_05370 [Aquimarina sp. RZ0]